MGGKGVFLGRKCLLKNSSVTVYTSGPESERQGTPTSPSRTVVTGHSPTVFS